MAGFTKTIEQINVNVFLPETAFDTAVYFITGENDNSDNLWQEIRDCGCALISVFCNNWNNDLTPWSAPAVFKNGDDFGGGAKQFLSILVNNIVPEIEKEIGAPECRCIAGYSLAGLFSVYAFYETDLFPLCGAPSGGIWYDDFVPRYLDRRPGPEWGSIFFSVGDREGNTKNDRMARNEKCMKTLTEKLNSIDDGDSYEATFCFTKGTHFDNSTDRIAQAVKWLVGKN